MKRLTLSLSIAIGAGLLAPAFAQNAQGNYTTNTVYMTNVISTTNTISETRIQKRPGVPPSLIIFMLLSFLVATLMLTVTWIVFTRSEKQVEALRRMVDVALDEYRRIGDQTILFQQELSDKALFLELRDRVQTVLNELNMRSKEWRQDKNNTEKDRELRVIEIAYLNALEIMASFAQEHTLVKEMTMRMMRQNLELVMRNERLYHLFKDTELRDAGLDSLRLLLSDADRRFPDFPEGPNAPESDEILGRRR